jgi:methionine aminopeptidase
MHHLHIGTYCLQKMTEGKGLLSVCYAYVGYTSNTCVCINNISGQGI